MSYQEKRIGLSIVIGIIILVSYCVFAISKLTSNNGRIEDISYWARMILYFIVGGIVMIIIIQIIFHIILAIYIAIRDKVENEPFEENNIENKMKNEMVTDEMDKLIELKSMRLGFSIVGIGFMVGLISLVLKCSPVIMLNVVFVSFAIGSVIEGFSQIYFYRKGL